MNLFTDGNTHCENGVCPEGVKVKPIWLVNCVFCSSIATVTEPAAITERGQSLPLSQYTVDSGNALGECWADVGNAGLAFNQRWLGDTCLL